MFGSKEKKIETLVRKAKWEKLSEKYLEGDAATRLILATECAKASLPGVNSILTRLLRDKDEKVQMAAVKSIAITGRDAEVAQLQWLSKNIAPEKTELLAAIQDALSKVRGRR